jgi:hypothetical protein
MLWKLFKPKKIIHFMIPAESEKRASFKEISESLEKKLGKDYHVIVSFEVKDAIETKITVYE